MSFRIPLVALAAVTMLASSAPVARADGPHWWTPKIREKETAEGAAAQASAQAAAAQAAPAQPTPSPADQQAKADPQASPTPAGAPTAPPAAAPTGAAAASTTAVVAGTATPAEKPAAPPPPPLPDESLKKTIGHMRQTAIGSEPTATQYLDRIEAGHATAAQVNDFATYLAKRGMPRVAAQFQDYAVKLNPADATLWLNLGTMRRAAGSIGSAESAFKKAIGLDMGNAMAHYNLGALYDHQKNYDAAMEEYRRALVLDMDLADPRKNPQVVNNEHLMAARLQIYQEQGGSMGLPLQPMQKPPAQK